MTREASNTPSIHPLLEGALEITGRPRFYPPGHHPAVARYRAQRDVLLRYPSTPERDELLDHIESQLAMFEERESRSKQDYLRRADDAMARALDA